MSNQPSSSHAVHAHAVEAEDLPVSPHLDEDFHNFEVDYLTEEVEHGGAELHHVHNHVAYNMVSTRILQNLPIFGLY